MPRMCRLNESVRKLSMLCYTIIDGSHSIGNDSSEGKGEEISGVKDTESAPTACTKG